MPPSTFTDDFTILRDYSLTAKTGKRVPSTPSSGELDLVSGQHGQVLLPTGQKDDLVTLGGFS